MSTSLIGKQLGKYKIIERLGSGGMADVYKGVQVGLEREVAIKVLPPAFAQDREMVKRFRRESQATAKLSHPNIITIYDSGEQEGYYYYVMEYLKADSLEDVLEKEGKLPIARVIKVAQDIIKALVYTHEKDIIHRDLKPGNIKFDLRENAIVTDFGLVKDLGETAITLSGAAMGTPQYMSPEQLKGEEADARSDLYQVGIMMYEMLAARTPLQVQPQQQNLTASKILGQKYPPPSELRDECPEELSEFVMKSLCEDAEERFQTAKEMLQELRKVELKQKAKKLSSQSSPVVTRSVSLSVATAGDSQSTSTMSSMATGSESVWASSISAILASPKDRDALIKLMMVTVPMFLGGVVLVLWALGIIGKPPPQVVEKFIELEATRAVLAYKSSVGCFSQVEFWPVSNPQDKRRSKMLPILQAEHRHVLDSLRSDTTYQYRILLTYDQEDETNVNPSEVFDFRTRPEIQIFNIHAEEHPDRVIITWETNLRTDTTVRYGREEGDWDEVRTNPDQTQETMHMITIEGLSPDTLYYYQIVAKDPKGRGVPKETEPLTFSTPANEDWNRQDNSLVNLTKSYVDKLTRMTPDEREKLKASIEKFTGPTGDITTEQKKELLDTDTNPNKEDEFNTRLQQLRNWMVSLEKNKKNVSEVKDLDQRLQKLYYTNKMRAAKLLDEGFNKLSEIEKGP